MIRRSATLGSGHDGYVLEGIKTKDSEGNESFSFVFEHTVGVTTPPVDPGQVTIQPATAVKFTDGSPAIIESQD